MTSGPDPNFATWIDAYLDGRLTPAQRAELERRAAADPRLAQELGLQERIDDRLRGLMAPPPIPTAAAPAGAERHAPAPRGAARGRRRFAPWIVLAAVLLAGIGVWAALARPWGPAKSDLAANALYERLVQAGFKPMAVCDTDQKFRDYTRDSLGVELVAHPPAGVEVLGWSYSGGLLNETAQVILARLGGKPVIAVLGPQKDDRAMFLEHPADPALRLHRQERFGLVLYEVSPSERPVLISTLDKP